MSSAEEPLIANPDAGDDPDRDGYADADDDDESVALQKQANESSPGLFIWLLACSAGISGLLFGCESPLLVAPYPVRQTNADPRRQTTRASSRQPSYR